MFSTLLKPWGTTRPTWWRLWNSINSAMKWLWKRSTPSDWVWAKHLYSQSAIYRCLSFSTQHWETPRAILLCVDLNPTDWACLCVWVCARTCVCLYLSAYARGCVWREGMLAYLRKSLSICVPATTHTTNLYRRGKRQQTCTLVILMSVCFSKTGDFICLYKEKKYGKQTKNKCLKHAPLLLYFSVLSAGLWCDYCTVFPF